ncbi:MAG: phosphoribosyl-AMP cyclohydrolase [Leptospiraceae bacterium]|nr:phosphoribosyl-AMP cyclohydrolase [Leptospiraceae bacterium]MCP5498549.1 phosphoribosyl-AMP cyclohydrolase [Leptospiraceae bacterium]
MEKPVYLTYQDEKGDITGFEKYEANSPFSVPAFLESAGKGRLLLDCDEDSFLFLHEKKRNPLSFREVQENFQLGEGLYPVICLDTDKHILMQAFTDCKGLQMSFKTRKASYFSRSRNASWLKGETSGHYQHLISVHFSESEKLLLYYVEQEGAACHTGRYSCFYREYKENDLLHIVGENRFISNVRYNQKRS